MVFNGFVLLEKEAHFDHAAVLARLRDEWGIVPDADVDEEPTDDETSDLLSFYAGGIIYTVTPIGVPVPDHEAEVNARCNWMWDEAEEAAKRHRAQFLVAVMGDDDDSANIALRFAQLTATLLADEHALGVYVSGTVHSPEYFRAVVRDASAENRVPHEALVFIGLYRDERGSNAYTIGLDRFGKDEMEIVASSQDIEDVLDLMASVVGYVVNEDVCLQDGETIGFSAEHKLTLSRSPAAAGVSEYSLKIGLD